MAFYLKPPHGSIPLANIQSIAWHRLRFLMQVSQSYHSVVSMKDLIQATGSTPHADCLIEGSPKDATSHFLLRLACVEDPEMRDFFIHAETQLFAYRFSCMTSEELYNCIKPLRRIIRLAKTQVSLCTEYRDIIAITNALTESYGWRSLIGQFVCGESAGVVRLPFVYVCELVRRRAVVLDHGIALVPCSKLCDIMITIFRLTLQWGMILAQQVLPSVVESDTRMAKLVRAIKVYFHTEYRPYWRHSSDVLTPVRQEDVDSLVDIFPPCMSNIHQELRLNHRLPHFSRIEYTLYLKELGLPVHEALQFWRSEYSKPQTLNHKTRCRHRWETDGKRYTYNIRHLYGLEGARINYRGHCCNSIQNRVLSGTEEGGCPFKHYDKSHLIQKLSLAGLSLDSVREILLANQNSQYNHSCQIYLTAKLQSLRGCRGHAKVKMEYESHNTTANNDNISYLLNDSVTHVREPYSHNKWTNCGDENSGHPSRRPNTIRTSRSEISVSHHSSQLDVKHKHCINTRLNLTQQQEEEQQTRVTSSLPIDDHSKDDLKFNKPIEYSLTYKQLLIGMKNKSNTKY